MQKFDGKEAVRVYATDDPELAVAEYRLRGHVLATGKRFVSDLWIAYSGSPTPDATFGMAG
ncbi:hypothetical protein [Streptomyces sp. ME18-1-4]|uniref:hypothetical protein n=1 Tax=Streptomyces sp. ME18-1-4 TaxID=3028685 RepID=UPI0029A11C6F|nr:hypothetical protein [Streptomyces sp. ME18-1-4]MDX3243618.1 hypothetical protein [Streptomyces sp. ME18-1-4]